MGASGRGVRASQRSSYLSRLSRTYLARQVGVVREGELDGRDQPVSAVNEERIRPQQGGLVRNGRNSAKGSFSVDAVASGVSEGGGQIGQGDPAESSCRRR